MFGFNNIWIDIDAATSAQLNRYLKEQKLEHIREPNDLWESIQLQRAAYLTEHRANIEPIERICENADRGANEFASIGVRFCYVLNAGGLVVIPAIMELLPETPVERPSMLGPAVLFACGILLAAIANYLAYHSQFKLGKSWSDELNARAKEVGGKYYPPNDQAAHQAEIGRYRLGHKKSLESANSCRHWGIGAFICSIILFIAGVGYAICGIR